MKNDKSGRETVLLWLTIATAVAGGFWTVFTYLVPKSEAPARSSPPPATVVTAPPATPLTKADDHSVAIGGNVSGSSISVGGNAATAPADAPARK